MSTVVVVMCFYYTQHQCGRGIETQFRVTKNFNLTLGPIEISLDLIK